MTKLQKWKTDLWLPWVKDESEGKEVGVLSRGVTCSDFSLLVDCSDCSTENPLGQGKLGKERSVGRPLQ